MSHLEGGIAPSCLLLPVSFQCGALFLICVLYLGEHTTFVYNDATSGPLVAVMTAVNPKMHPNDKSKLLIRTKSARSRSIFSFIS